MKHKAGGVFLHLPVDVCRFVHGHMYFHKFLMIESAFYRKFF